MVFLKDLFTNNFKMSHPQKLYTSKISPYMVYVQKHVIYMYEFPGTKAEICIFTPP